MSNPGGFPSGFEWCQVLRLILPSDWLLQLSASEWATVHFLLLADGTCGQPMPEQHQKCCLLPMPMVAVFVAKADQLREVIHQGGTSAR